MARGGPKSEIELPANLEAEAALLGAIMYGNEAMGLLPSGLEPGHFSEPFHQRLFARMRIMAQRGQLIEPLALASAFSSDRALEELGGTRYLADLVDRAPPAANAPQYARVVIEVGVRRHAVLLGQEMIERALDSTEDPTVLLGDIGREVSGLQASNEGVHLISADDAMDQVLDYIDNPAGHAAGILTGLAPLDDELGPWLPGDLVGLGGRPGMGKSALAAIIGRNVAAAGGGVIEAHAEMSVQQVWRRRLTATAYEIAQDIAPAYSAIRKRTIEYAQRELLGRARESLRGMPLYAVKRTGMTLGHLRALALRQKAAWERQGIPLALLTIDHAGLLKTEREHRSRVDQQTEISNGLKELADELGIPILVLLQLSREVEKRDDKRPVLSDFRDSGSWEQDLDIALGAFRPAYYAVREKEPPDSTAAQKATWAEWDQRRHSPFIEIPLLKVREGDASGTPKLWANMRTNTILGEAPRDNFFGGL